ncbi:hydrogenase maturation nickel metallochaperone HypA [Dictyobacter formicarum]|uniref:Hydrogenase maturation factor HypA n=1 Tax=Dictyobacter formicarum TaxID=2778368 RepID=A0ABQ3VED6_9CHLR|nr:hydrogenase maturation nickel metallochaperone HypA [Dictyobacter formicarum]GHO83861.1 putative hydrogenase nickel incorporation protein HypA [Dictyobacter formicarum]
MHELSIADAIAGVVTEQATLYQATCVKSVHVRIGEANAVDTDALLFCFEVVASAQPMLSGAQLAIDIVPHRARCRHCGKEFHVVQCIMQCPACESWEADVLSGTEFMIQDMEIDCSDTQEGGDGEHAQCADRTEHSGSQ